MLDALRAAREASWFVELSESGPMTRQRIAAKGAGTVKKTLTIETKEGGVLVVLARVTHVERRDNIVTIAQDAGDPVKLRAVGVEDAEELVNTLRKALEGELGEDSA